MCLPGVFIGAVGRGYDASDWDEPLRDYTDAWCAHGEGRMFAGARQVSQQLLRLKPGMTVWLDVDMARHTVAFELEGPTVTQGGPNTTAELPGLPDEVAVAVCFGARDSPSVTLIGARQTAAGAASAATGDGSTEGERKGGGEGKGAGAASHAASSGGQETGEA